MFEIKPKTRKEIYMAYLAGDMSLELPEPMTRDEVNLYNLCKNRAYGETTTVKEVLPECQPEFNADWNGFVFDKALEISVGEKYTVNWNGVDFECVCEKVEADGSAIIVLGNAGALMDGEDTGEPFVVISYPGDQGTDFPAAAVSFDGSTTLTISIRQEVTEVKKISGKYVEGMGYSEVAKTVIFSGDVEMVGQDVADVYFTTGYAPTGLSSIPEEVTITVDGVSTVVAIPGGSFSYNGKNIRADISKGDDGNWSVISFHHGGNNNYTIEDITIEAVTETIHPINEKLIVLTSPNGTKYKLSVADDGTLSAVAAN